MLNTAGCGDVFVGFGGAMIALNIGHTLEAQQMSPTHTCVLFVTPILNFS